VRNEATIKTVKERIRQNLLRKQNSLSQELNISPPAMSHLIRDNLHESLPAVKGSPPYSHFERVPIDKNRASPPVARKHPFTDEKISPSRSSTTAKMTRFMLKHPVRQRRKFQWCKEAITLPTSWFCRGVPSGGDISSFLQ
jgi:hypothetical protein